MCHAFLKPTTRSLNTTWHTDPLKTIDNLLFWTTYLLSLVMSEALFCSYVKKRQFCIYFYNQISHKDGRWAKDRKSIHCSRLEEEVMLPEIRRLIWDQWSGFRESQHFQVSDALMFCITANMHTTLRMQEVAECLTGAWPHRYNYLHTYCKSNTCDTFLEL